MARSGHKRSKKVAAWLLAFLFLSFPVLLSLHHHKQYQNKGINKTISQGESSSLQSDCPICHLLSQHGPHFLPQDQARPDVMPEAMETSFLIQTGSTYSFQYQPSPFANSPPFC